MTVELISVGTEILMGNIVNSNTQFLAEKCAMLGFDLFFQVTVGDNYCVAAWKNAILLIYMPLYSIRH